MTPMLPTRLPRKRPIGSTAQARVVDALGDARQGPRSRAARARLPWATAAATWFVLACTRVDGERCIDAERPCLADSDCAGGTRCNTALDPPMCTRLFCGTHGDPCSEGSLCAEEFTCAEGICPDDLPVGAPCGDDPGDFPCEAGLRCAAFSGWDDGYGICASGTVEGSPCRPDELECSSPLRCAPDANGPAGHSCFDPGKPGTPCDGMAMGCTAGLTCGGDPAECAPAQSGSEAEACIDPAFCAMGLTCRSLDGQLPTCRPPAAQGDRCVDDDECAKGLLCTLQRCRERGHNGDPCENSGQCVEGLTCGLFGGNAVCLGPTDSGDLCELHTDCFGAECVCRGEACQCA